MTFDTTLWELDLAAYLSAESEARIALLEERSRQILQAHLPVSLTGWCGVCQSLRPIEFRSNFGLIAPATGKFHPAYSETGTCTHCQAGSRKRFAVELLRRRGSGHRLYMTEHVTPLREHLLPEYPDLISSEYFGEHAPGAIVDGVRHEDLHDLSFPEGSFDAILCLDVLEHVNDPVRCAEEMVRVLAPGGIAILTFPFFSGRDVSIRRAEVIDRTIIHHLPAQYHGNPLGGGALVFWELSWAWVRDVAERVHANVQVLQYWSALNLHLGNNRMAVLITKRD